jgi:pimeloyl-ACP methyl ester carboxylesterase
MTATTKSGYAPVNGLQMYYEVHGEGEPLVLLHGGLGFNGMFGAILPQLAAGRQVIAADLQGHGRTADIDRPLSLERMGDDVAALIRHLGYEAADVMGYSMGGGAALRAAIQHPALVRKLVLVSVPYSRSGWYAENLAAMDQLSAAAAEYMKQSPMYQGYVSVAPRPEAFPELLDKMGDMVRRDYDWSAEVTALAMPVLLVYGDADGIPASYIARFFELLGGGKRDPGWDRAVLPSARLAILPGATHYDVFYSPLLPAVVTPFLEEPLP